MKKIMRFDVARQSISVEDTPPEYKGLAGRGLTSTMVAQEVPPVCNPLGAYNKLVIAPGLLSGTYVVNSGRLSIGLKSPLTGGIKESNVGGTAAYKLGRLGVGALVIEGGPEKNKLYILHISVEGGRFIVADEYRGHRNYELVERLRDRFGKKTCILSIGPVGEMLLPTATIACSDTTGVPCRHAGRGGAGAVMGSKGIKAIVIDDEGAQGITVADPVKFKEGSKKFAKALKEHPLTSEALRMFGTNVLASMINAAGAYPTRNFREGTFEDIDRVSGEHLLEVIKSRGGTSSHAGCSHCIIKCSNVYVDEEGTYVTSAIEYETVWAHGANLGISDLDSIAKADRLCDDYGMDSMEIGAAIGVAMEGGVREFGDAKGALELLEEIGKGTPLGRILGSGSWSTGRAFGVTRIPVVKKQGLAAYDPRAIHGMGVTYATSPMGADHTAGWIVTKNLNAVGGLDPHKPEGQVSASIEEQILTAAIDCTGLCLFVGFAVGDIPDGGQGLMEMIEGYHGAPSTFDIFVELGKKVLGVEHAFNHAAGFTKADDRLPEFFREEFVAPHNVKFTVTDEELNNANQL